MSEIVVNDDENPVDDGDTIVTVPVTIVDSGNDDDTGEKIGEHTANIEEHETRLADHEARIAELEAARDAAATAALIDVLTEPEPEPVVEEEEIVEPDNEPHKKPFTHMSMGELFGRE